MLLRHFLQSFMNNYLKNIKNAEILIILLFYLVFFTIGLLSFKDFGTSIDEWELRVHGFVNLKYVILTLFNHSPAELDKILKIPELSSYYGTHGAYFAMIISFIEYIFNVESEQKIYFISHFANYLIFILANFYFFLIIRDRFNSFIYGLLGALFLFLSPRIFAESFYNQKDILFLSMFIINIYYGILFIKKPSLKNSILLSISTALAVDIRILGLILVPIILFSIYVKFSKNIIKNNKLLTYTPVYIILFPVITVLFWPYLWSNPFNNLIEVFSIMSNYGVRWGGYNLYFGEYILGSNLPWHYTFVWIFITTPILYLLLFVYGFLNITLRTIKRFLNISNKSQTNDLISGDNELSDLVHYLIFAIPIFLVISLNSTLYDGWRHLYFIYPSLLYISLKGLYLVNLMLFKNKNLKIFIFIIPFLAFTIYEMIVYHPHQNVYFNFLAGKNIHKNFENDYWGLSNKQAFEFLLINERKNPIYIGSAGPISLENSKKILSSNDRDRLVVKPNNEADYIIDNYRNWFGEYNKKRYKLPDNFKIYKEISRRGRKIISIYKKT
jgi:hypothetical protein